MTALETRLRRLEERHGPFNGDEVWGPVETAEKNFWKAVAAFEAWFTEADRHSPERHMNHNVAQHVAWLRRFQSECDLRAAFVACGWRGVPGGSLGWILGNSASRGDLDL